MATYLVNKSGAHDLGVLPLGGPVVAGDQAHAVQAIKVAEHEGIAGFRLVRCAIGEREVPGRVLRPTMSLKERVLLRRAWLDVSPPAAHPVLTGVDQAPSLSDSPLVHQVRGHELSLPKIGPRSAQSRPRSWAKADSWRRRQQVPARDWPP